MEIKEAKNKIQLSQYKEVAMLNKEHGVFIVQRMGTSEYYVKKEVSIICRDVYIRLMHCQIDGIPKIIDIISFEDRLVIIEEYIPGKNLQQVYDESGPLSDKVVADYTMQLCEILTRLHGFDPPIIHRDIKPSNIILKKDGSLVLIDFNAAKEADPSKSRDTYLIGTPGYSAPEQYGFGSSYIPTDIYAVGNLMLALLTGDTEPAKLDKSWLKKVIFKCLNMDPKNRYQSADKLRNAIKHSKPSFKILIAVIIIGLLLLGKMPLSQNETYNEPEPEITTTFTSSNVEEHTAESNDDTNASSPVGTYVGNDGEKLVIADNGLAYYYCNDKTYSEVQCPWNIVDNILTIQLSKLHCKISDDVITKDFSSIELKSDSRNWNDETFEKISSDVETYIISPPPAASSYIEVMEDGVLTFDIGSFCIYVPKQFRDIGNIANISPEKYMLIDVNADTGFAAAVVAEINTNSGSPFPEMSDAAEIAKIYANSFLDNVNAGKVKKISIAGEDAFESKITGDLNAGFTELKGRTCTGKVVIINDSESNSTVYMFMIQTVGTGEDDGDAFQYILDHITKSL